VSHILIADDDASIVAALRLFLKSEGFQVTTATSPAEVEFLIKSKEIDLALIDLNYQLDTTSGLEGVELTQKLKNYDADLAVVCMTGWATVEIAVQVMQSGAGDFIQKPWENDRLLSVINNQLALRQQTKNNLKLTEENNNLKQQIAVLDGNDMVAESAAMKSLLNTLEQIAKADINILITGENGTGKSLLASHIHQLSTRADNTFVSVNMGAITDSLFESEMFGHVKGAFTDAKGTLFLDEIANIPLAQQVKLLRLLEEHQYEKVGASKTQQANIRVISATNSDLQQMVQEKSFRQDLLFRLNTFVVEIPPLRTRLDDILPMAEAFIVKCAARYNKAVPKLSVQAEQQLLTYQWPGNVRELSHTLERATLLAGDEIFTEHLMLVEVVNEAAQQTSSTPQHAFEDEMTMDDIEKAVIEQRLKLNKGNASDAAKSLAMSRSAFYRRLDKFGL
jgi:DNA-binding NtrC family response regulator